MENEDIETKPLESSGDADVTAAPKPAFAFSWEKPAGVTTAEPEDRATEILAKEDKFVEEPAVAKTEANFIDALSIAIDHLQGVYQELWDGKLAVQQLITSIKFKTQNAGVEFEYDRLDDPFDDALRDLQTQIDRLERQRNRARMAAG